jgi:hypothetical protein
MINAKAPQSAIARFFVRMGGRIRLLRAVRVILRSTLDAGQCVCSFPFTWPALRDTKRVLLDCYIRSFLRSAAEMQSLRWAITMVELTFNPSLGTTKSSLLRNSLTLLRAFQRVIQMV